MASCGDAVMVADGNLGTFREAEQRRLVSAQVG